jgi:hypothetical protein
MKCPSLSQSGRQAERAINQAVAYAAHVVPVNPSKRRVRTDQGPLPSTADIYPGDVDVQNPQLETKTS